MKITKEQGRACLNALGTAPATWGYNTPIDKAVAELGWCSEYGQWFDSIFSPSLHADLCLCLCAEIAGVRP